MGVLILRYTLANSCWLRLVKAADPGAQVEVDLAAHRVKIQPAGADEAALAEAIREAGYTPRPLPAGA